MIKNKSGELNRLDLWSIGRDRERFVENLSLLTASGMPITEALRAMSSETHSKKMSELLLWMQKEVSSGSPLWRVLETSRLFPPHAISLIRIGEETGRLSKNLEIAGRQEEKDREFSSKVRSAMMYPVFVLVLTLFIGIGIASFILPKLALVFSQLKVTLPLITKILIGAGTFLGEYGSVVIPSFVLTLFLCAYFLFYFPKTKAIGQALLFWIPGIKNLITEVELARFSFLLGTMLHAGLPVVQAISSVEEATVFFQYKKFYAYLKQNLDEGNSFQKSFAGFKGSNRFIPGAIQQLIVAGEKSGTLSDVLLKINANYETKIDTTTKNITVILEPVLLVIVWLGVVFVALAVILPIYSLIGGFKTQ